MTDATSDLPEVDLSSANQVYSDLRALKVDPLVAMRAD